MSLLYDFYVKPNEKLMHFSILKRVLFTVVTLIIAVSPALAQDMIARQAPVDRKMKAVDTLALKDLIHREQAVLIFQASPYIIICGSMLSRDALIWFIVSQS